jgi:site-specific recombinase XerD
MFWRVRRPEVRPNGLRSAPSAAPYPRQLSRRPKHKPRPFTRGEVDCLLALDLAPMERVLRAVLFGSGLRVTPICGLKVGDVNEEPPQLRAVVKGSKIQAVPIQPELRDLIVSYGLAAGRLKGQEPLFAQRSGRRLTRRLVENLTHEWGEAAGVPDCLPHRFRHTDATRLPRAGVDVRVCERARSPTPRSRMLP